MIKLMHLITEINIKEGEAVPGAMEGWLSPSGACYYVTTTHAEWAAEYLDLPFPNPDDLKTFDAKRIALMNAMYSKGWIKVVIVHNRDILYLDSSKLSLKNLSRGQTKWIKTIAIFGAKVVGDKIVSGNEQTLRHPPYRVEFGNTGEYVDIDDL